MVDYTGAHKATRLIGKVFEENDYKFTVDLHKHISVIKIGMVGETIPHMDYYFFSSDEDNDVSIHSGTIVRVPEDKIAAAHRAINQCNNEFRFARFSMTKDNGIRVSAAIPLKVSDECLGEVAHDLLLCLDSILDDAYPILMKAIWA